MTRRPVNAKEERGRVYDGGARGHLTTLIGDGRRLSASTVGELPTDGVIESSRARLSAHEGYILQAALESDRKIEQQVWHSRKEKKRKTKSRAEEVEEESDSAWSQGSRCQSLVQ